jgi:hypothetical protein
MIVLSANGNPATVEDVMEYARRNDDEAARLLKRGLRRAAMRVQKTAREWREIAALMVETEG